MKTSDMEIDAIRGKLEEAVHDDRTAFLPSFLSAYGISKTTIRRMEQAGPDPAGRISIRQKLLFVAEGGVQVLK